ncbi:MAG: cytochrome c3 family protein [Candidatus Krumholzibacteriia bacterium]
MADDHVKGSGRGTPPQEQQDRHARRFLFPRWTNLLGPISAVLAIGGLAYLTVLITLGFHPRNSAIGYAPEQPVPYSHALHVGELGMDCRYCHTTVETAAHAAIPPAEVCMNCHKTIHTESPKLLPVREAYAGGARLEWVKIHDRADYAYFDHSAHVNAGVGCVSCHGRVDRMEVVSQQEKLTMSWCLDCHRNPEPNLRPVDQVTNMEWVPDEDPAVLGARLRKERNINPSTDCTTCHR